MSWWLASGLAGTEVATGWWLGRRLPAAAAGAMAARVVLAGGEAPAAQPASTLAAASPAASRNQGLMGTRMPHGHRRGGRDW